jgi:hypothetical protein
MFVMQTKELSQVRAACHEQRKLAETHKTKADASVQWCLGPCVVVKYR